MLITFATLCARSQPIPSNYIVRPYVSSPKPVNAFQWNLLLTFTVSVLDRTEHWFTWSSSRVAQRNQNIYQYVKYLRKARQIVFSGCAV
jgi:hypothetical protein